MAIDSGKTVTDTKNRKKNFFVDVCTFVSMEFMHPTAHHRCFNYLYIAIVLRISCECVEER